MERLQNGLLADGTLVVDLHGHDVAEAMRVASDMVYHAWH
jgi:hypothetical protein